MHAAPGNGIANPAPLAPGGSVTLNINSIFAGFIAAATDGNSVYGGASLIYVNLNVSFPPGRYRKSVG